MKRKILNEVKVFLIGLLIFSFIIGIVELLCYCKNNYPYTLSVILSIGVIYCLGKATTLKR